MLSRRHLQRVFWSLITLLLFALHLPAVQAAGCVFHDTYDLGSNEQPDERPGYVRFPSSNFLKGSTTTYSDSNCQTRANFTIHFGSGAVHTSDSNRAWEICQANNSNKVTGVFNSGSATNIFSCTVSDQPFTSPGGARVEDQESDGDASSSLLPLTGLRLDAFDSMGSGIQFKRIDHYGVGVAEVIAMGFLDAVDVWSNVGRGYSVCFPQAGRIVFLDAATAPRTLMDVENVLVDGFTCAAMDRAGTMVLVQQGAPATAPPATPTRRPGTNDSVDDAIPLEDCTVTTLVNLRIREAPWGKFLAVIPANTEVPAAARTKSWFNVTYEEWEGWSAAWLTSSDGGCEWADAD